MCGRREIANTSGYAPHGSFSDHLTPSPMAIQLRLLGTVTDAPRTLSYTKSGMPRISFGVRVGSLRSKHYLVVGYGTMARFADIFLHTGNRVRVSGAFLRRYPAFEGLVRAHTIRHVGGAIPPYPGTLIRFVPAKPRVTEGVRAARPIPHGQAETASASAASSSMIDEAIAAAVN